jgi:hypothetical protein
LDEDADVHEHGDDEDADDEWCPQKN